MRKPLIASVAAHAALFAGISAAQADEVRDFLKADRNGDGLLQKAEFQSFIQARANAGDSAAKWVVRFGAWGRALKTVDYNRDGQVSGDELRKYDASR